jgi:hypothetical protein
MSKAEKVKLKVSGSAGGSSVRLSEYGSICDALRLKREAQLWDLCRETQSVRLINR